MLHFVDRSSRRANGTRSPNAAAAIIVELYRSERWRRYFKEEKFLAQMREAIQNTENWAKILERMTGAGDRAKAA